MIQWSLESVTRMGNFSLDTVLMLWGTALLLGLGIALLYRRTGGAGGGFPVILALIPMLVSAVIMIINGNLGTSVAVLGAFGLIRFRSAPGTARDIGFLFYALCVGLAAGLGFLTLAALLFAVVAAALLLLDRAGLGRAAVRVRHLRITVPEDLNFTGAFDDLLRRFASKSELEKVRTSDLGATFQLEYRLELRRHTDEKEFLDALRCRNGNLTIVLGPAATEKNTF